jgi:predicted MFS family arabinose efflux permease
MNSSSPGPSKTFVLRRAIVALSAAAFGSGMSMRVADPMLVRLSIDFSIPLGMAAWVVTVFGLAYGVSQLFFGPLGDRYGKYLVIAWGCLACAASALLCGLMNDFFGLLLARGLAGATAAAVIPLSMAWIGDVVRYEDRQSVLARFLVGQILGLSTGVLVGGWCADYLNWRSPFFLIALWFFVIGLYLIHLNRSLPSHARVLHKVDGNALARLVSEFRAIFAVRWARTVLLTVFVEGGLVFVALAFLPTHLHQVYELSLSSAGALVMLFGLGGLIFALGSRVLVRRLGEVGLTRYGAALMGFALLVVAYSPVWWITLPACLCFGLGFYMLHNTLQINATQMAPERRGAAVAAFASCFFLGQSTGVALGGGVLSLISTDHLIAAAGLGVLLLGQRFSRQLALKTT